MRKHTRWLGSLGICAGAWVAGDGGLLGAAGTAAVSPAAVGLGPRTSLHWSIVSAGAVVMSGESEVAPNGMLEVGPYGSVAVGGLTLEQARAAVEKQVGGHVAQAHVSLYLASAVPVRIEGNHPDGRLLPVAAQSLPVEDQGEALPLGPVPDAVPIEETAQGAPALQQWRGLPLSAGPAPAAGQWRPVGAASASGGPVLVSDQGVELPVAPRLVPMPGPGYAGPDGVHAGPPVPHEHAKVSLPPYVIDPPDVLLVQSTQKLIDQPISGPHLIRPDGTISLGIYGTAHVAGMTLDQAKGVIAAQLSLRIKDFNILNLVVDVLQYNSKFYYVITDGGGTSIGEQVVRFRIEGSETVLDALSQVNGLSPVSSRKDIWVARAAGASHQPQILPVDWCGITQRHDPTTNYQVMPGDRIYVKAQKLIRVDSALGKVLHPIERVLGITLLGSSTVNSIRNGNSNRGNNSGF